MNYKLFIFSIIVSFSLLACSTTRVLREGELRLEKNFINIENNDDFNSSVLIPYVKQTPNKYLIFNWNPSLNIYNWSNGKDRSWDKLVQKAGVPPVVYDSTLVVGTMENIKKHLEYLGYFDSKVTSKSKIKKKRISVEYNIELGKRYKIKKIDYNLPDGTIRNDLLSDSLNSLIKAGDYLSESLLEEETSRMTNYLRNKAYYNFSKNDFFFEADTLLFPGEAILTMCLTDINKDNKEVLANSYNKFYINNVSIEYPEKLKFRTNVLKNLNTIIPGTLYSEKDINNTYSRLSGLQLFRGVNIELTPVDTNKVDCFIDLSQSNLQGFKLNLETSSNSSGLLGISPQLSYYHKNFFNGGEWFNLSFMGNFQFKTKDDIRSNEFGVSTGLSFPNFLFLSSNNFKDQSVPRTELNISYNYQDRPEYTRNIIATKFGYSGNLRSKFFFQFFPIQLSVVRLENLNQDFFDKLKNDPYMQNAYKDHFDLGLGSILYYTTNPQNKPKTSFAYSRLQFDISGNLLSIIKPLLNEDSNGSSMIWNTPFAQYVRADLSLGKTMYFGEKNRHSLASRLQLGAGFAYGNSSALPFEKHFYAGGANSLRGWQARTVGPGMTIRDTSFVIPNQTGDMKIEANLEYRFRLFWKLEGATFLDAGNVWSINELTTEWEGGSPQFSFKSIGESIALNWGLGLRLDLDFLVLRVDSGFRIHDPARNYKWVYPRDWIKNNGYAVHFGVGYPF